MFFVGPAHFAPGENRRFCFNACLPVVRNSIIDCVILEGVVVLEALTSVQRQFLKQHLGVSIDAVQSGTGAGPDVGSVMAVWRDAKDQMDRNITALTSAMKNHGHPVYKSLAEFGLGGVLEGANARIVAALVDFDGAPAETRADVGNTLAKTISSVRESIGKGKAIDLLDQNPFGISMDLRATLESAFDEIEAKVRHAA